MYYRGAAAAIVVYDITNPDSFAGAQSWVKELQRRGDQNVVIAMVSHTGVISVCKEIQWTLNAKHCYQLLDIVHHELRRLVTKLT